MKSREILTKINSIQFFPCNYYRRYNEPPKLSDF